ncbi:MAG: prepilin-type N-terminal cleavage/methylation domain-containing protein [Nitrospirota bacterium]
MFSRIRTNHPYPSLTKEGSKKTKTPKIPSYFRRGRGGKGFTLIEIMISLAILGGSFIVLLGLRNRDIAISSEASHIVTGTLLARQKVTDFAILKERGTLENTDTFDAPFGTYQWEMSAVETGIPSLRQLSVTVHWVEQKRREEVRVVTYFLNEKK